MKTVVVAAGAKAHFVNEMAQLDWYPVSILIVDPERRLKPPEANRFATRRSQSRVGTAGAFAAATPDRMRASPRASAFRIRRR